MTAMTKNPLLFLAHVALDTTLNTTGAGTPINTQNSQANPFDLSSTASSSTRYLANLHIPCEHRTLTSTTPKPLKRSNTSNSFQTARSLSTTSSHKSVPPEKQSRRTSRSQRRFKGEMRAKRRSEHMQRAMQIKTLGNSPVNERQLGVLRMIYDEITMYPNEYWMALTAIIIHRSFKQVKNWFSNERQKNKSGEVVAVYTDTGDKIRLRPLAVQLCLDWSDTFFHEVVTIYHYKTLRCLKWREAQLAATVKPDIL